MVVILIEAPIFTVVKYLMLLIGAYFATVSPEVGHAVSVTSQKGTLLITPGYHITLRWLPESLVPSGLVNNVTVDISIYLQDSNGDPHNPRAEFTEVDVLKITPNNGEASVSLKNYQLACSPASGGVTYTVCPVYFKVSVSSNQYLPSDLAIWFGTVYYRSESVTDSDMVDQCEQWRQTAEDSQMLQPSRITRGVRCPPNVALAILDPNFRVEDRTSVLTQDQLYHKAFLKTFHSSVRPAINLYPG